MGTIIELPTVETRIAAVAAMLWLKALLRTHTSRNVPSTEKCLPSSIARLTDDSADG